MSGSPVDGPELTTQSVNAAAAFGMSHLTFSMNVASTVVDPPEARARGRFGSESSAFISEDFLLNFRPGLERMGFGIGVSRFFQPDAAEAMMLAPSFEEPGDIDLPSPRQLRGRLSSVIEARRSSRNFVNTPIPLRDVSTLLHHAAGVTASHKGETMLGTRGSFLYRANPSGGGLYPIDLYLMAVNVSGLERGAYKYLPYGHSLQRIGDHGDDVPGLIYSADFDSADVGFGLVYVYDLHRNSLKYGDSGLVFAMIEVGAIAQNLHLARTSMGLGGVCQGGWDKQRLEAALGLDGVSKHVTHLSVVGHTTGE